jgi:non-structural maintenance of chromosomes element 4
MKDTDKLIKTIKYQDGLMGQVRQTSDAVLDSRFLLDTTELSSKKIANEAFGSGSLGVDVDLFVSRCITFMKLGGNIGSDDSPSTSNQTRRNEMRSTTVVDDEDDDPEEDDPLAWDVLGSRAAFLCNRRPAAPSFLLGPLAVEKRVRNTQRAARSQRRDPVVAVSRPEELQAEDLEANQSSNVTKICNGIKSRLQLVLEEGEKGIEMDADEDMTEEEAREVFRKHNLSMNFEVPLFEFAFNPHSFAQTVENLFYVSFLVRDGYVRLTEDDQGLPTLSKFNASGYLNTRC